MEKRKLDPYSVAMRPIASLSFQIQIGTSIVASCRIYTSACATWISFLSGFVSVNGLLILFEIRYEQETNLFSHPLMNAVGGLQLMGSFIFSFKVDHGVLMINKPGLHSLISRYSVGEIFDDGYVLHFEMTMTLAKLLRT